MRHLSTSCAETLALAPTALDATVDESMSQDRADGSSGVQMVARMESPWTVLSSAIEDCLEDSPLSNSCNALDTKQQLFLDVCRA